MIALLLTFIYVLAVLAVAYLLEKQGIIGAEGVRKLVHILVSFTVFPIAYCITEPWARLIGPALFIFINGFVGGKSGERMMGLVCYPFSMLLLAAFMNRGLLSPDALVVGTLSMGLGDGAAALVGMRWGRLKIGTKTAEGSAAMFIVTFSIFLIFGDSSWYISLLAAVIVTAVEAMTPHGLDNLSVPISAAILMEVL